jgi:branched-chain amino acid transport system permease protein
MTGRGSTGLAPKASRATLRGRPGLHTRYAADQAIWDTNAKKVWTAALVLAALAAPFLPFVSRSQQGYLTLVCIYAIGGIGLNLVTGYAGQVSLGHAFFIGLGAYTATFFGGAPTASVRGLELDLLIWLPMAGLVPGLVGLLVAPLAARVRGLYLAILTLGLVFLGEHLFKELRTFTGGPGVGRRGAEAELLGFDLYSRGELFGIEYSRETPFYLFCLLLLIGLGILARNLARSSMGRAFAAIRDRDIAAEVMGVPLLRTKVVAFGISSFYAGIAGGLLTVFVGQIEPLNFNLLLSVEFLAIILIGGVATISGSIIGAAFVVLLPPIVQILAPSIPFVGGGNALLSTQQLENVLFGGLIVAFLVLEPRGLFGLWLRVRNYWKAWPFSY